ncbi:MAG TPA: AAA family ATPase [Geopsychrobacteraceae bacterium]
MCKKIFVAATGQHCGKTTTSLSLIHLARRKYRRIGFIKPMGPKLASFRGRDIDVDAALIAQVYGMEEDLEYMSPVVIHPHTTRDVLDGKADAAVMLQQIKAAVAVLERKCDFLIIEGAGHAGVGAVFGLSNAVIAAELQAPVLLVAGGGIGSVIDDISLNLALFREAGAEVRMLLPNKLIAEKRERTLRYLRQAFRNEDFQVVGGFNYSPILADPPLNHLADLLGLELRGTEEQAARIVHHVQLGAAAAQRVVDILMPSTLLVVTSSRDELLVMISTLYHLPEFQPKIAGMLITGVSPVADIVQRVLDDAGIPYMRTRSTMARVFTEINEYVSKIRAEDREKIALVQQLAETELSFETIDRIF